jgi:uncharacterized protein
MSLKADIMKKLREMQPSLQQRYAVTYIGLFGSVVREEDLPDSDIDILLDIDWEQSTLQGFDYLRLIDDLESQLGKKVDVVTRSSLHPILMPAILAEAEEVKP